MAGKKIVATTVSNCEVGFKRREEGKTMSSQEYTESHTDQRDDNEQETVVVDKSSKHVDVNFPWCMKREKKNEDHEAKTRDNENSRNKGRSRQKTPTC